MQGHRRPSWVWVSAAGLVASICGAAGASSPISDWNEMYFQALREGPFAGPGSMARDGALMHTAIFNAVNAIDGTHVPYGGFTFAPAGETSKRAAVAYAAHQVMTTLYPQPDLVAQFDATLASNIAGLPEQARVAGQALGHASAQHILALRGGDGWDGDPAYTPGSDPGDWQPTQPGPAVHPHWGKVQPWGLQSGSQFRSTFLTDYGSKSAFLASPEYTAAFNDVKNNGGVDRWTPADEQYQIAFFWGNDRDGTYHPPGHHFEITQTFLDRELAGLSEDERLSQEARTYAMLGVALADAAIASWDTKFNTDFDLWRPITAIQAADTDGNPLTEADPNWEPLNHVDPDGPGPMQPDPFSPQFPAFVSGHATFGAAHSAVMELLFGGDEITGGPLEIGTDDPYVVGLTRTFEKWSDMALENGRSRVYLGVHWQFDADEAYIMGSQVGDWIFRNYFQVIPAPGATTALVLAGLLAARRRRG